MNKIKLWFTNVNKLEKINDKIFIFKNYLINKDKNILFKNKYKIKTFKIISEHKLLLNNTTIVDIINFKLLCEHFNPYIPYTTEFIVEFNDFYVFSNYTYETEYFLYYNNKKVRYYTIFIKLNDNRYLVSQSHFSNKKHDYTLINDKLDKFRKFDYSDNLKLFKNYLSIDNKLYNFDGDFIIQAKSNIEYCLFDLFIVDDNLINIKTYNTILTNVKHLYSEYFINLNTNEIVDFNNKVYDIYNFITNISEDYKIYLKNISSSYYNFDFLYEDFYLIKFDSICNKNNAKYCLEYNCSKFNLKVEDNCLKITNFKLHKI